MVFTDPEVVMLAEKERDWQIIQWQKGFVLMADLLVNIKQLIDEV